MAWQLLLVCVATIPNPTSADSLSARVTYLYLVLYARVPWLVNEKNTCHWLKSPLREIETASISKYGTRSKSTFRGRGPACLSGCKPSLNVLSFLSLSLFHQVRTLHAHARGMVVSRTYTVCLGDTTSDERLRPRYQRPRHAILPSLSFRIYW